VLGMLVYILDHGEEFLSCHFYFVYCGNAPVSRIEKALSIL
jgi:hypothetical protein